MLPKMQPRSHEIWIQRPLQQGGWQASQNGNCSFQLQIFPDQNCFVPVVEDNVLWRIYSGLRCTSILFGYSRWDVELGFDFVESVHLVNSSSISPSLTSYWGNLTDDKSLKIAPNGPNLHTNRQVHAKQEVGQLHFFIHNIIIYFWGIKWVPIQSLINHPIQEFPYKVFIYVQIATYC